MTRISLGITAAILGGIALASASAHAQGLVTNQKLSAALANELVGASVAECAKKNYAVTAAVVDLDGVRQAVLRGDGAPIHTLDNAFYKAYSSASLTLSRKEESTGAGRRADGEECADDGAADPAAECHLCEGRRGDHGRRATSSAGLASAAHPAVNSTRNAPAPPCPRSRTG